MKKGLKIVSIGMVAVMLVTTAVFFKPTNIDAKKQSKVKSVKVKGAKKKMTLKVGTSKTYKVKAKVHKSTSYIET